MKLIALTQLTGVYGSVETGQEFEVADDLAKELLRLGHVRASAPPPVVYETKVIVPQEAPTVAARRPFRHVPVPDEEPSLLAPGSDPMLQNADLSEPGIIDPGRRSGRARSSPRA